MRHIANFFYLIIWVLIKIGDSVLFLLSGLLKLPGAIIAFHKPLFQARIIFPSFTSFKLLKRKKHLKKSGVLFKAQKKKETRRRPQFTFHKRLFNYGKTFLFAIFTAVVFTLQTVLQVFLKLFIFIVKIPVFLTILALMLLGKASYKTVKAAELTGKGLAWPVIFSYKKSKYAGDVITGKKKLKLKKKKHRKPSFFYSVKLFFWGVTFSSIFIFVPLIMLVFLSDLPNPSNLSANHIPKTTKIYDRNGILLYEIFANQNRTLVQLDEIPANLKQATIAIEDKDFYTHPGFDLRGIARAAYANFTSDDFQGGSTITQQLIKSALLTPEPTVSRKVKEVILAFWAERVYSKDKILEMYFNYVPYGGTAWGIQAASDVYFGKDVNELNLSEASFLAGLPRAPSVYSPYSGNGDVWKKRQKEVLNAMVKMDYISQKQADEAYKKELSFKGSNVSIKAPHFVMYVRRYLIEKYGLSEVERGGLQVYTTLDLKTQEMAQEIVSSQVSESGHLQISNGAALVLDPRNGDILAMVGSRDYFDENIDGNVNLTTALRQPGSTIKIVTYALALSTGFTEGSLIDDSPLTITPPGGTPYTPVNYDGRSHGRVPLRMAFANSYNITAVRVAQTVGVPNIVEFGRRLGITTWNQPENYGVSITLGGADTTMIDLATVYATAANGGKKETPNPILEIKDTAGSIIYKKVPEESKVMDPGVAFIISDILADNKARESSFGPNSPLHIPGKRVSVKTGTTDSKRDNWTIGFTPNLVVATWVGNNDNSPMSPSLTSGISGAAPIWNKIMTQLLEDRPSTPIVIPDNIVARKCFGRDMYFLSGTDKNVKCTMPSPSVTPAQTARAN